MYFFPKLCALNIGWHSAQKKWIKSYIKPKGCLTKPSMANFSGSHKIEYNTFIQSINQEHHKIQSCSQIAF